ncbi:MAG: EAL domain-containing protein [Alphaproteobacteria bacterium]|nr:EAL domain-containing protein [Alphaproteobacteria bacterium]
MFTALRDSEAKLVEMASRLRDDSMGWRGVHYNFSKLLEHYKSEYQIKIAVNIINDFLKDDEGGLFVCNDSDLILLVKGVIKPKLDKVTFQLRYLFMDDPMAYSSDGSENSSFCDSYDLTVAWEDFFVLTKKKLARAAKIESGEKPADAPKPGGPKVTLKPFTPARLAAVETDMAKADVSRIIRKQPVCAVIAGKPVKPVFDEFYINIGHLRQMLMPDVDLASDRWLFKYLTQILDKRVLDMLAKRPSQYFGSPVSLNLNVATVLSAAFQEFDDTLKASNIRSSIVIEFQIADIFADMKAFIVAKQAAQKMGYRVCLDGLTNLSITQIDRERLGFDLAKLQWNADYGDDMQTVENQRLLKAAEQCGPNRLILTRCDNQEAVNYGHALGISLFQGRHLDAILNPQAKVVN